MRLILKLPEKATLRELVSMVGSVMLPFLTLARWQLETITQADE